MAKATFKNIPVLKGDQVELQVDAMAYDNAAISRHKDFVVMVNRAAPGDKLVAEITTIKPNYARATIKEIISCDDSYRIEPECKVFKVCGGCQWQHLPYEKQIEQKNLLMKSFVEKLKLPEGILQPIIDAGEGKWNYRNKVQYPVRTVEATGRLKAGYYEWNTNDLINIKHCPIQDKIFEPIIDTVRDLAPKYEILAYDAKNKKGWLRHICVRYGATSGQALLTLIAISPRFKNHKEFVKEVMERHPNLVGICTNINRGTTNVIYGPATIILEGKDYLIEEIKGIKYRISATSFFQVNNKQAETMLSVIDNFIGADTPEIILDAYCGVGFFTLHFAKRAKKVIGVEEVEKSIQDAKAAAKMNNINNTQFIFGKVENKIEEILETDHPEIVIIDPPRVGCNKKVIEAISGISPAKIIYVSCNPSTLIRDLGKFMEFGYNVASIQPIDMFPHTYHIENIVMLTKNQ